MRPRGIAIAVVLGLALWAGVACAIARADKPVAHSNLDGQPWVTQGLRHAYEHWHAWPTACAQVHVVSADLSKRANGEAAEAFSLHPQSEAECVIFVDLTFLPMRRGLDDEFSCDLLTHELGHLLGWEHPDDPSTEGVRSSDPVMRADLNVGSVKECRRFVTAKRAVRSHKKRRDKH
jgi:hypothetical protein